MSPLNGDALSFYLQPVSNLATPLASAGLSALKIHRVVDLLFHAPTRWECYPPLDGKQRTCNGSISVKIASHHTSRAHKMIADSHLGKVVMTFFKIPAKILMARFPVGSIVQIFGAFSFDETSSTWNISHPKSGEPKTIPIYPTTDKLAQYQIIKTVQKILALMPDLPEWLPEDILGSQPAWKEAMKLLHSDPDAQERAKQRLACDEIFAEQCLIDRKQRPGVSIPMYTNHSDMLEFKHNLTECQKTAIEEISLDLSEKNAMHRLLQGEVGSGKSLVAYHAAAQVIAAGFSVAMITPTETLALQQHKNAEEIMKETPCILWTSNNPAKFPQNNESCMIISTHAILYKPEECPEIGLVIIDEQHKFGVEQRRKLIDHFPKAHLFVITATPIPRSMALTKYGDLKISTLKHRPYPVNIKTMATTDISEAIQLAHKIIEEGGQIYWICHAATKTEYAAAERYKSLQQHFETVELMHGQMLRAEMSQAMEKFTSGVCRVLVATTVIEVGIDVQNAKCIVIENSEMFGIAQLHQLRGRIGRDGSQATCILLTEKINHPKIQAIINETNGFNLAEYDWQLRGCGELWGSRQSGHIRHKFAQNHIDITQKIAKHCREVHAKPKVLLSLLNWQENNPG